MIKLRDPKPGGRWTWDRLIKGVNPRAKLPSSFGLWSTKLQLMWLRQHQLKEKTTRDQERP